MSTVNEAMKLRTPTTRDRYVVAQNFRRVHDYVACDLVQEDTGLLLKTGRSDLVLGAVRDQNLVLSNSNDIDRLIDRA